MKKAKIRLGFILILAIVLSFSILVACGGGGDDGPQVGTKGLKYQKTADGQAYTVVGIGSASSAIIEIADVYKKKPVIAIGDNAFANCTNLTKIIIPNTITSIGVEAFNKCTAKIEFATSSTITTIGKSAFTGYEGETVNLPLSVTTIDEIAFARSKITSMLVPNNVTSIGSGAFNGCNQLQSIRVPFLGNKLDSEQNAYFEYIFGGQFSVPASLTSVEVTKATVIGESAFSSCENLVSVKLNNGVTTIGDSAFYGCKNMTQILMGNSVQTIGDDAFAWCAKVTSFNVPVTVTSIGKNAFSYCTSLREITL